MMSRIITAIIMLVGLNVSAQNLVPNPSFEDYNQCPQVLSTMPFSKTYSNFVTVKDWSNPVKNSTPDYYNRCANFSSGVDVPLNGKGYQEPLTGDAYAGIIAYNQFSNPTGHYYSEHIYCKLKSKLIAGVTYNVSFYVSATYHPLATDSYCALDRLGAYFSDTIFYTEVNDHLVAPYHIKSTQGIPIDDTSSWTKISGEYTAHGGEEYMVIGNMDDNSNLQVKDYFPNTPSLYKQCYYYIDDVSVIRKPHCDTLYSKIDTFFCHNDSLVLTSSALGANSYTWNQGQSSNKVTVYAPGVYWCRATSDTCDYYVDSFVVKSFVSVLEGKKKDTVICLYDSLTFTLNATATSADRYVWSTGDTTVSIAIKDTGTYWCRSIQDCVLYQDTFKFTHTSFDHTVDLGADTIICNGETYTIGKEIFEEVEYIWNTGEGVCCITPDKSGKYQLTVTDGCTKYEDEVLLEFDNCINCILIPSAFSPNQDGMNDQYRAFTRCGLKEYELLIYNRWGEQVYRTTNITSGWDGQYKGQRAEVGVYYYLVKYKFNSSDEMKTNKGNLTLIR